MRTCVAGLATVCHQCVLVQWPCLVIAGLEDSWAAHRGLGGGDDGEVLASNSK
jgi:hypothetical protein